MRKIHTQLICFAAVWFAVAAAPATAAAQGADQSYQTWLSFTAQGPVTPEVTLYVDTNFRMYDDFHPYQVLVRPAVGLKLMPGMLVWAGYAWTPSWTAQRDFVDEHRAWEQWTFDVPGIDDGVKLYFRTRFEQRFRPETSDDVGLRLRQFVRVMVPFGEGSPLAVSVWDEVFVPVTDAANRDGRAWQSIGFDQNRLFLGLSVDATRELRIEAGYLNHWIVRAATDEVHHAVAVNAFLIFR